MSKNKEVLCPECFKGNVIPEPKGDAGCCDKCATPFTYKAPTTVRYS